jgi:putative membrane protein
MSTELSTKQKFSLLYYLRTLLSGFAIGIANVIPGVSGGTFALVLGIYDNFITAFDDISRWVTTLIRFLFGFRKEYWEKHRAVTRSANWLWILILFVGIIVAIVATSGVITYLLENYPAQTYGLFFGLIVASVVVPWSKMEKKGFPQFIALIIAFAGLFFLTGMEPNPNYLPVSGVQVNTSHQANIVEWEAYNTDSGMDYAYYVFRSTTKSDNLEDYIRIGVTKETEYEDDEVKPDTTYYYTVRAVESSPVFWFVIIASAISAAAMILPGLSGSFLLLLMGVYSHIFGSFSTLFSNPGESLPAIALYALGIVIGLLAFARVLKWFLAKYHSITMGFLIGLMLGSLRMIYPFLDTKNAIKGAEADEIPKLLFWDMPSNVNLGDYLASGEFISIVACLVFGVAVVLILHFATKGRKKKNQDE